MDLDARPIAAYRVTLTINGHDHDILTSGRDEQEIRRRIEGDALRRTKVGYEPADRDVEEFVVEWGNVTAWDVGGFQRGGTWQRQQ